MANYTQKDLASAIKSKIQNEKYQDVMLDVIYNYFINGKNDKSWDLRNSCLVGIGDIVKSSDQILNKSYPLKCDEINSTYQMLIIQNNTTKECNCLLLHPVDKEFINENELFRWGFTCFDNIQEGIADKDNWIVSNIMEECYEIEPKAFDQPIPMTSLLSKTQLDFNDIIIKDINKDELSLISVYKNKLNQQQKVR